MHALNARRSLGLNLALPLLVAFTVALALGLAGPAASQDSQATYLYWSAITDGEIWRAHSDGNFVERVGRDREIYSLAIDVADNRVYFGASSGQDDGELMRSRLDGSEPEILLANKPSRIRELALDIGVGKIYMIDSEAGQIARADLNGSAYEVLISGVGSGDAMDLDLEAGKIYYDVNNTSIHMANLDGTGSSVFRSIFNTAAIEVDTVNDKVYSCHSASLERCDLDGSNCEQLGNFNCSDVEIEGTTLYTMRTGVIWQSDLDGGNEVELPFAFDFDWPTVTRFVVDAANNRFYFRDGTLFRTDMDGSNPLPLSSFLDGDFHGFAVDGTNERLFAAVFPLPLHIMASNLENPAYKAISLGAGSLKDEALENPRGMAVSGDQIFFASNLEDGGIWRCGYDFSNLTEIVPDLNRPHDVALDSAAGKIYWTQGIESDDGLTAAIRRADLDGQNVEDVLTGLSRQVRGIAVDSVQGKIYWTDAFNDAIYQANLDGSSPASVVSAVDPHDVAVDPVAGHIFWTEGIDSNNDPVASIRRANLDGSMPVDILTGLSAQIREIVVVEHRNFAIFADGFESGDVESWTSALP